MVNPGVRAALRVSGVLGIAAAIVVGAEYVPQEVELQGPSPRSAGGHDARNAPVDRVAMVCPGPEQQGLADAAVAEVDQRVEVEAMGAPSDVVEAALAAAEYRGVPPDLSQGSIAVSPLGSRQGAIEAAASVNERGVAARTSFAGAQGGAALALGGLAPGTSATQLFLGEDDESLGLAVTPCVQAAEEAWLIAGGGASGRSERLVLLNPGQSPIAVSAQVWGSAQDPVGEVGDTGIALEPGERQVLLVDALAPSGTAPVVHVVATGGPVSAYLGDRELEGTTEVGMELTGPVAAPGTSHVIPSVDLPAGQKRSASVRVAVAGADSAVVEITAWGEEGAVPLTQDVTLVPGQRSADIAITDLPPGTYALQISSDEEIVASAVVSTEANAEGQRDLSWAASVPAVTTLAGAPLPQPGQGRPVEYAITMVAPQGGDATVFTITEDGDLTSIDVDVDAGEVSRSDLGNAAGVWVVPGEGEVFASVQGHAEVTPSTADPDNAATTARPAPGDERAVALTSVLALTNLHLIRSVAALRPTLP